jgi:hypothetical protein
MFHPQKGNRVPFVRLKLLQCRLRLSLNFIAAVALAAVMICPTACSSRSSLAGSWSGPEKAITVKVEPSPQAGANASEVHTQHYTIYSTIADRPDLLARMGQLMEGAFLQYRSLVPQVPPTDHPMLCYLFGTYNEWANFTVAHTGADSEVYLKISRGGYTIQDWYVSYFLGNDIGTYSVAAHEGWHQFVARHFKGRLPPFLEEGLACMFEDVDWDGDLPRWNLSLNPSRTLSLRKVLDEREQFPLSELITLHAGQVVGRSGVKIEAFYAQNWAFARFLWEGENKKYRPALQQLLADTAAGIVADPTGSLRRKYLPWNPEGVRPMLEHYLGQDLSVTQTEFDAFMKKVAYQEMSEQFGLN